MIATRRFFAHYRPELGIVLETEIWPRLFEEAARAGIPVVLANGRLSARSARRYARAPGLTRWAFSNLAGVAAQTDEDAKRFAELVAAGLSKFILRPLLGGEEMVLGQTRRLIDEVLPAVAARWPRM